MGVLADIYSGGNTLKRRVNALIKDPAGTLGLGVTRFGEDQNQLINLMRNAYPMAGEKTVLNRPQQVAQFRGELADKSADQAMAAATVWHGSPHKFDKFDSSKIGTGEGAQAYGHGLYLAESPVVANSYRTAGDMDAMKIVPRGDGTKLHDLFISKLEKDYDPFTTAPSAPKWELSVSGNDPVKLKEDFIKSKSSLYKVDLPDEHIAKMLDWDRPLNQQHPDVQAALSDPQVMSAVAKLKQSGKLGDYSAEDLLKLKGEDWHDILRQANGDRNDAPSAFLKSRGIPGIRYLDGGSRGAGGGTSNFVVFPGNESMLSIMERNGQPVLNKLLGK